jgi:hypothetical protein
MIAVMVWCVPIFAATIPSVVVMNGQPRSDLKIKKYVKGVWSFTYERDLQQDPSEWLKLDTPQTDMRWKNWPTPETKWMNGLYGHFLTFQVEFPVPVNSIQAQALVANHTDGVTRQAFLEYSLDGIDFNSIAETSYGGEVKEFSGTLDIIEANINRIWIRLRQGGTDANTFAGSVVFKKLSFTIGGRMQKMDAADVTATRKRIEEKRTQQLIKANKEKFAKLESLLKPLGNKNAQRRIGVVSSMADVFPGEPPAADQMKPTMYLTAARRESESAQIVVSAGPEPLYVDRVLVSELRRTSGKGTIKAGSVDVRLVGYTNVEKLSWRGIQKPGLWPDPLLKLRPFVCPAGQARSLWVTVNTPPDAVAGTYSGSIRVVSEKSNVSIPIKLHVSNFTLPAAPVLHTSYWSEFSSIYNADKEPGIIDSAIRMFGAYRVSTSVAQPNDVVWYREADGSITADWSMMRKRLELALKSGFRTLNIGPGTQGVWGDAAIAYGSVIDRVTGKSLTINEAPQNTPEARAKAYLTPLADWLQKQGAIDKAYLGIRDEDMDRESWKANFLPLVKLFHAVEPRIQLNSVLGIHPILQEWFDVPSPHQHFYDAKTYQMLRDGISLYGQKNFGATVIASSTGGWGGPAFYNYDPTDAYDGCEYTKWIPKVAPTESQPQWLRFDFDKPEKLDGIRIEPFDASNQDAEWVCEGSADGIEFNKLQLTQRDEENCWSLKSGLYKVIRIVWTKGVRKFVATDTQPLPPPDPMTAGVREVEFLQAGMPLESTRPRSNVRPVKMIWEYQVAADYPSVCIDADPSEIRATGWQCWVRGVEGYLNYGAAQWGIIRDERPLIQDPMVWVCPDDSSGPGAPAIVYPGKDEVLPSIRLARFRDGVDDYDYLSLLAKKQPNSPLLEKIRRTQRGAYHNSQAIESNRLAVGKALETK